MAAADPWCDGAAAALEPPDWEALAAAADAADPAEGAEKLASASAEAGVPPRVAAAGPWCAEAVGFRGEDARGGAPVPPRVEAAGPAEDPAEVAASSFLSSSLPEVAVAGILGSIMLLRSSGMLVQQAYTALKKVAAQAACSSELNSGLTIDMSVGGLGGEAAALQEEEDDAAASSIRTASKYRWKALLTTLIVDSTVDGAAPGVGWAPVMLLD